MQVGETKYTKTCRTWTREAAERERQLCIMQLSNGQARVGCGDHTQQHWEDAVVPPRILALRNLVQDFDAAYKGKLLFLLKMAEKPGKLQGVFAGACSHLVGYMHFCVLIYARCRIRAAV